MNLQSVSLELTHRCNRQCLYCYNACRHENNKNLSELKTKEILKIIDLILDDVELEQFTLTGGEPFLRKDIFKIIDHINDKGLTRKP